MHRFVPVILAMIVVFVLGLSLIKDEKQVKILSFRKNYNVTSTINEEENLYVNLYINANNSYITDVNQLTKSYIIDKSNGETIEVIIKSIYKDDRKLEYANDKYNSYIFEFSFNLSIDSFIAWYISNAILELTYNNQNVYNIKIGNFSFVKIDNYENNYFSISNIKPLTYEQEKNVYLGGLILGLRNVSNSTFRITDIEILNCDSDLGEGVRVLDDLPSTNEFSEVAGFDYNLLNIGKNQVNITVENQSQILIYVPIYHKKNIITPEFAIKFNLNNDTNVYLYDYIFYEPVNETVNKSNINIYDAK